MNSVKIKKILGGLRVVGEMVVVGGLGALLFAPMGNRAPKSLSYSTNVSAWSSVQPVLVQPEDKSQLPDTYETPGKKPRHEVPQIDSIVPSGHESEWGVEYNIGRVPSQWLEMLNLNRAIRANSL